MLPRISVSKFCLTITGFDVKWKNNIEIIYGAMFSGKTEELIRRLVDAQKNGENVEVFKPDVDERYTDSGEIVSHSGWRHEAQCVSKPKKLLSVIPPETEVIGIDEAQFFDQSIKSAIIHVAKQDTRVITAGLSLDFRGDPFGPMPSLLRLTPNTEKLYGSCAVCGEQADRTQRLIDGEPAHVDDPLVIVGGEEMYEPRCEEHHIVKIS